MTRLDDQYVRSVKAIRGRVEAFITSRWDGLGSWRDGDIDAFVQAVVPVVTGGQRQVSTLTDAYLAQVLTHRLGRRVPPVGANAADVTGAAVRNGAEPAAVYQRPFHTTWTKLGEGHNLTDAVGAGRKRLTDLARTDLQLAKTHTTRAMYGSVPEVRWFRRELVGSINCGMCVVASSQRYHRGDLLPIHPGCDCRTVEILSGEDPGQVIDPEVLDQAHGAIEASFGVSDAGARAPDYRKMLLVREHGEMGPLLTVRGHKFTDVDDVARAASRGIPRYTPR